MPGSKPRVAVIGGGVAGLIVARHLAANLETFSFTLFEQTGNLGGTWVYTDETEFDRHGLLVHSSMYKNLRTNLPKEIMQIPDFPYEDKDGPSYVHHSFIRNYLSSYAQHFNLSPHTKLNTVVKNVEPETLSSGTTVWIITSQDLETKIVTTTTFDAVILCNGRDTVGNVPHIKGIESFTGKCIHSHQYRSPESYVNKKVCILGASFSGIDIAMEVSECAEKLYLSHNYENPMASTLPKKVIQTPGISSIHGNTFVFENGVAVEVDEFIYCTGYLFTCPFLSEKVKLNTDDNYVEPIYKHLVYTDIPGLFFMGLPTMIIPFPMFHIQAPYILKIIEGRIKLPSPKEMREEIEAEKKTLLDEGISRRHIIQLKDRQWSYYDEIAGKAEMPRFPPVIKKILDHVSDMRLKDITTYKNYQYRIVDSDNFLVNYCEPF